MYPLFLSSVKSLDEHINDFVSFLTSWFYDLMFEEIPISDSLGVPWVLIVLFLAALFFTVYFRLINLRGIPRSISILRGKLDEVEEKGEKVEGQLSHFQALTAAISATVGLGNIAGVAIALSIGGYGATFWMIVLGFLGMATKLVECTLGVRYRQLTSDGVVLGGPMYYLSKGLGEVGFKNAGRLLAVLFALMCVGASFGGGNMFQSNQAFELTKHMLGGELGWWAGRGWLFGLIFASFVGLVIIGGIQKIAKVTERIVPLMVLVYLICVLCVLITNADNISIALTKMFSAAFSWESVGGGMLGAIIQGFRRAAFSNEAGVGSASIAHAAVKTKYPASEGFVALLEPFIDTVVVCTLTALTLMVSGVLDTEIIPDFAQGAVMTANALATVNSYFPYLLLLCVLLFAFSSMISWSYYGLQAWTYLFGKGRRRELLYKFVFCLCVMLGAAASLGAVIDFCDAMIFGMMVPNIIGLFLLRNKVRESLDEYDKVVEEKLR